MLLIQIITRPNMSAKNKTKKVEEEEEEEKRDEPIEAVEVNEAEDEEILDYSEELNLKDFVGKVIIIESARIDQGTNFNVVRMRIKIDGKEYDVRTTSKAIENTVKTLIEKGLNQGKKFRVCVQTRKSRYATDMLVFVNPSLCEKVK